MDDVPNNGEKKSYLVPVEKYLEVGVHIGTKIKTGDSARFIFKRRADGIYIIDIDKIDERIRLAANLLKNYDLKDVLIVATRIYASNAALKMKKLLGDVDVITRRFIPGTLTNPELTHFREPKIMIVCDPRGEKEALREAGMVNIPVIGLLDTDNTAYNIDLAVPINNKGRKSLAMFFWLITRELMLSQGKIKSYDEFKVPLTYFERLELEEE